MVGVMYAREDCSRRRENYMLQRELVQLRGNMPPGFGSKVVTDECPKFWWSDG